MKIHEFELLTHKQKEDIVFKIGILLINYEENNDMCDVYELFDFYVAVCYKINHNSEAEITASLYPDELPHLTKISNMF